MNNFFMSTLNDNKIQFVDFDDIIIKDSLVVIGKYNKKLIETAIAKDNKIILFLNSTSILNEDQDQIDIELLKSNKITVICDEIYHEIYDRLIRIKMYNLLYLRPTYKNIMINVILLLRDNNRVDHVNKRIAQVIENIKIFPAIDALTPHAIDNCVRREKLPILKPIRAGKIGCLFSHLLLWKELIESDKCAMMILEDDNIPVDNFGERLNIILDELSPTFDILHLCITKHLENPKVNLQKQLPCAETCAYIISRKGANKLISSIKEIRDPLEIIIQKHIIESSLETYSVGESIFTNIGKKNASISFKDEILLSNTTASKIYVPDEN